LSRLDLDHNSAGPEGAYALSRGLAGGLSELRLRNNELDVVAVKLLAECPGLRGLRTLDLSENPLEPAAQEALFGAAQLAGLRRLDLAGCDLGEAGLRLLRRAPWLHGLLRLNLSNNPIGDRGLAALLADGGPAGLNELVLESCRLTAAAAEALDGSACPELRWLDLSKNTLGARGAEALARSGLTARLAGLRLGGGGIGDGGASALAAGEWPLLTELGLEANGLTEAGAQALARSATLPRLREVRCARNAIRYDAFHRLGPRFRQW
jgi:Ran GTPase-activating protein (RanGAP) involved in mRNA processing and transport